MQFTEIQISSLREGTHSFHFELDSRFSESFTNDFFSKPNLKVEIILIVSETMIQANLNINGDTELICDRSLRPFRRPIKENLVHFYKYGEEEAELSDELDVIHPERVSLDFDQLIYDTIALSLPQKKLHPEFEINTESENEEGQLIYSTAREPENEPTERDNRWDILKNLN
jgi:uncharacterized metal-binding protein YceD (DUF177 family)